MVVEFRLDLKQLLESPSVQSGLYPMLVSRVAIGVSGEKENKLARCMCICGDNLQEHTIPNDLSAHLDKTSGQFLHCRNVFLDLLQADGVFWTHVLNFVQ